MRGGFVLWVVGVRRSGVWVVKLERRAECGDVLYVVGDMLKSIFAISTSWAFGSRPPGGPPT